MTTLWTERSNKPLHAQIPNLIAAYVDDDVVVRGRDKSGRRWRIRLPAATHDIWFLKGEKPMYFFDGYTGGAGMAPGTWIFAVSFDEQGRPVPFFTTSQTPFEGLVELDGGGPFLLQQTWLETNWLPKERSGYYVTVAYRQKGAYWYRADGVQGGRTYPFYERWALLPNVRPKPVADPQFPRSWVPDNGNHPQSGVRTHIRLDSNGIHAGRELDCQLDDISAVVLDSPTAREIEVAMPFANGSALLREIAERHLTTTLTGVRTFPKTISCVANIAWAVE